MTQNKGFTLLELLISLSILSIIVVLVFGAFNIGVKAWEKGEYVIEQLQIRRIALELIKSQISAMVKPMEGKKNDLFLLKGDAQSLSFVSCESIIPGNKFGIVKVKYLIQESNGKKKFSFYEENTAYIKNVADIEFHDLIIDANEIFFEYLKIEHKNKNDPEEYLWTDSWDVSVDKDFPKAIGINLIMNPGDPLIRIISRIN
ncbi:MAG: prepilin-type N-terminal cleavage/methylation domain-containing protein [Desulfobacterales bacterium]|nr:prepilin-type N-terminal cleavage/methylation domain-containing protein [Desulfobacterales bacterium]